ncbi:MAG: HAD family hydrolase [Spirochaetota bacterium]
MAIRAVAFDIDGTLYPNWGLYLMNFGFGLKHYRRLKAFAKVRYELHRRAVDPVERLARPTDLAGFRALQARLLSEQLGCTETEAASWAEEIMYGELEAAFDRVRPFPGVEPALKRFAAAGLRLAALSDFPAPRKLETIGLRDYFEVAMSSEETGSLKPAPDPFLRVAERLGLEPSEIFYVGNSLRLDIAGAKKAGMGAALRGSAASMRNAKEPYAPKSFEHLELVAPDLVFTNWDDLVEFILPSRKARGIDLLDPATE